MTSTKADAASESNASANLPNPGIFLAYNAPYVVIPFILLLRMRKPLPFQRKF